MKPIESWFQGTSTHDGTEPSGRPRSERQDGSHPECLLTACERSQEIVSLAAIIRRLFPERVCDCPTGPQIVHFNNHPDTTRDQVDKVVAEWQREEDLA